MIINTLPHQLDEVSCLDFMFNKDSSVHNWFSQSFPVGHTSPQFFSPWENNIHILVRLDWHLRLQARHPSLVHVNLALEYRPVLCALEGTDTSHSKLETRLGHDSLAVTLNRREGSGQPLYCCLPWLHLWTISEGEDSLSSYFQESDVWFLGAKGRS